MNTDRDLVLELLRGGRLPAALRSSPLARELAGEILALDAEQGAATLAFVLPERFAQGAGVLQGGILTALLDFAMAFAAHAKLAADARTFATASLTVHFLRPARPGRYMARGRIVRAGRKVFFAEAELSVASGGDETTSSRDRAAADRGSAADRTLVATASAVLPLAER